MRHDQGKPIAARAALPLHLLCFLFLTASPLRAQTASFRIVDPLTTVHSAADLTTAAARDTLALVGPRNGYCSAPVYVSGPALVTKPVLKKGGDSIPAESIQVRYAVLDSPYKPPKLTNDPWLPAQSATAPYYDVLQTAPPATTDLTPVWLTVQVPKGQAPGTYEGEMTIGSAKAPVRLTVSDWACPDPRDWTSGLHTFHSPETVAERYQVELWSDKHWPLVDQELQFAAGLGTKTIEIPIYPKSEVAQEPWVFFRQKGDAVEVDFAVVDKYLDLVAKTIGKPNALIVMAWNSRAFKPDPRRRQANAGGASLVFEDEQGAKQARDVPGPGQPGAEPPYRALFDGLRERMAKLGWGEGTILIGWATDQRPTEDQVAFFKTVAPYARWAIITHGRSDGGTDSGVDKDAGDKLWDGTKEVIDGMEIGFHAHPFAPTVGKEALSGDGVVGGWDLSPPRYFNARVYMYHGASLTQYRSFPYGAVCLSVNGWTKSVSGSAGGLATIPLDFWENDKGSSLLGRFDRSGWTDFHRQNTYWLVAPGPDGLVGTTRYEMLREGLQETEARIEIEKAIAGKQLPAELASACSALLIERMNTIWIGGQFARSNAQWQKGGWHEYRVAEDWQASTARLFEMAGKVAAARVGK